MAAGILGAWVAEAPHFRKVMPKDYRRVLTVLREAEGLGLSEDEAMVKVMEGSK